MREITSGVSMLKATSMSALHIKCIFEKRLGAHSIKIQKINLVILFYKIHIVNKGKHLSCVHTSIDFCFCMSLGAGDEAARGQTH